MCVVIGLVSGLALASVSRAAEYVSGDKVEVREGDKWSPATVATKEGRKIQIRYSDGTEEWVTDDRLRPPGAAAGAGSGPADVPGAADEKPSGGKTELSLDGPFTTVNLRKTGGALARASGPMTVKPTTRPSAPFTDLTPAAGADVGRVQRTIVCADSPGTVVVVGDRRGDDTALLVVDTNNPAGTEQRVLTAPNSELWGAASGGRVLATRNRDNRSVSLWEYKDGQYALTGTYLFSMTSADNRNNNQAKAPRNCSNAHARGAAATRPTAVSRIATTT
jgi:hypothetical protein